MRHRARTTLSVTLAAACLIACESGLESARRDAERARELARAGRADEALQHFRASLESSEDATVRRELARMLAGLGRVEESATEYVVLLGRTPEDATLWLEFGRLSREQRRDPRGAELAFRKAVELLPGSAEAHGSLGLALFDLGDAEGASAELQAALSIGPSDAPWRAEVERVLVLTHLRQRSR